MTSQKPDGIPVWAWLIGSVGVAIIGAYATIESGKNNTKVSDPVTIPATPTSTTKVSKNCIGVVPVFYQSIYLNQNQPPITAIIISSILSGYPASFSQLRLGDMITSVNGESVISASTLLEQVQHSENHVNLRILRPSSHYFGDNNQYWAYPPYQEYNIQVAIKEDCRI